jgi:hypothetical protein
MTSTQRYNVARMSLCSKVLRADKFGEQAGGDSGEFALRDPIVR